MAIRSMTGFGRGDANLAGVHYAVEVRTVNHRFLDLKTRLPRELSAVEPLIRRRVGERVERGRVDVAVSAVGGGAGAPAQVVLSLDLAREVQTAQVRLAAELGLPSGSLTAAQLLAWPGVLQVVGADLDAAAVERVLGPAIGAALDGLVEMRTAEGSALAGGLGAHLDRVEALRAELCVQAPAQSQAYRLRLEERLRAFLADLDLHLDAQRVLHEVAVFAERTDVAEELARLVSHLAQGRALIAGSVGVGVGRRLDFLCQEMLREANTIGSKVQDASMTERVIELKGELERLREQVQNVE